MENKIRNSFDEPLVLDDFPVFTERSIVDLLITNPIFKDIFYMHYPEFLLGFETVYDYNFTKLVWKIFESNGYFYEYQRCSDIPFRVKRDGTSNFNLLYESLNWIRLCNTNSHETFSTYQKHTTTAVSELIRSAITQIDDLKFSKDTTYLKTRVASSKFGL
jgi:hypothetical protein